jgi:hypothetical protein
MNQALVQYEEFVLSKENLRTLPLEHVSAMATFGYAVSEVNALRRIFLSQSHDPTSERIINEALNIQKLVILRTWSAKLFEIREFLETLCGPKPITQDKELIGLAIAAIKDLDQTTSKEGYEVARDVRNEATNHYSFAAAKKNFAHLHDGALCNMYIHRHGGNDFFPMGESVMFHGRLHRRWKIVPTLEQKQQLFEQWIDWCLKAGDSLVRSHAQFAEVLIFNALDRNDFKQRNYWVPEVMVGHPMGRMTPVFSRFE